VSFSSSKIHSPPILLYFCRLFSFYIPSPPAQQVFFLSLCLLRRLLGEEAGCWRHDAPYLPPIRTFLRRSLYPKNCLFAKYPAPTMFLPFPRKESCARPDAVHPVRFFLLAPFHSASRCLRILSGSGFLAAIYFILDCSSFFMICMARTPLSCAFFFPLLTGLLPYFSAAF